jgi:hypothetical protein
LPFQPWDDLVGEVYGSDLNIGGSERDFQSLHIQYDGLKDAQQQIELWAIGNSGARSTLLAPPEEDGLICYGTVGFLNLSSQCLSYPLVGACAKIGSKLLLERSWRYLTPFRSFVLL